MAVTIAQFRGFSTIAHFARCMGVQWQYIHRLEKQYRRAYVQLLKDVQENPELVLMGPGVFQYDTTDYTTAQGENFRFIIPRWAVRLLSVALWKCKPVPMNTARHEMAHGRSVYSGSYIPCHAAYIDFCVRLLTPAIRARIDSEEYRIRGRLTREYAGSRQVGHRSTERLFSESDISDIIDKTILTVFCPLIVRTIPIRGIGTGLCVMEACRVESAGLTSRRYPKMDHRRNKVAMYTEHGYIVKFTDLMTGEVVQAFTEELSRRDELLKLTSCTGVLAEKLQSFDDNPEGNPALYEHPEYNNAPEFSTDTVWPMYTERAFSATLVGVIRQHYRVLNRRTNHEEFLIAEHKKNRDARKCSGNELTLFEILKSKAAIMHSENEPSCDHLFRMLDYLVEVGQLNSHESAIIEAELVPDNELIELYGQTSAEHPLHFKRYEAFRDICTAQGQEIKILSPANFWKHRRTLFAKLRAELNKDEARKVVKRTPVPLAKVVRRLPLWKIEQKMDKRTAADKIEAMYHAVQPCNMYHTPPHYRANVLIGGPTYSDLSLSTKCEMLRGAKLCNWPVVYRTQFWGEGEGI